MRLFSMMEKGSFALQKLRFRLVVALVLFCQSVTFDAHLAPRIVTSSPWKRLL